MFLRLEYQLRTSLRLTEAFCFVAYFHSHKILDLFTLYQLWIDFALNQLGQQENIIAKALDLLVTFYRTEWQQGSREVDYSDCDCT